MPDAQLVSNKHLLDEEQAKQMRESIQWELAVVGQDLGGQSWAREENME